jgi:hypothetical protein
LLHIAGKQLPGRRHADDAKGGALAFDESHVHSELAVTVQELFGAVERVDKPVLGPRRPVSSRWQSTLLGDDRHSWRQCRECGHETVM